MTSPVPKHLRTDDEIALIDPELREHVIDLVVDPVRVDLPAGPAHRAKFAPGLATRLVQIAGTESVGDPMAGSGMLAWETGLPHVGLNDLDRGLAPYLDPLAALGHEVTYGPASRVPWQREAIITSPPYYPRTDRRKPNAHDDAKRGPVVGFRDSYNGDHPAFIGNPGGVNAILTYREQMTDVYAHLSFVADRMVVVTKNWWRLGVELRLDLDTILMAEDVGWRCVERHGWEPPPSLWARYNSKRGGFPQIEDVLVFDRAEAAR